MIRILFLLILSVACYSCSTEIAQTVSYTIAKTERESQQINFKIVLEHPTTPDSMIEISRQLRVKEEFEGKIVCFFYLPKMNTNDFCWATTMYLPQCSSCTNNKDADGTDIDFLLNGADKYKIDSLSMLQFDSLPNKVFIGSNINPLRQYKVAFYKLPNQPSKLLKVLLFIDGNTVQVLNLKNNRYWYEEEKGYYLEIDNGKIVKEYSPEGKIYETVFL